MAARSSSAPQLLLLDQQVESLACLGKLLGSIFLVPDLANELSWKLRAADFVDSTNRASFNAMMHLHYEGTPIEPQLLVSALRDAPEFHSTSPAVYLLEIQAEVMTAAHAEHYARLVIEASRKRRLHSIAAPASPRS